MRQLTDMQLVGLAAVIGWAIWYFVPVFLRALLDPYADRFKDVDELLERER